MTGEGGVFRRDGSTFRHALLKCGACGWPHDSATPSSDEVGAAPPEDGDWSVCFRCGEPAAYVVGPLGVGLRALTTEELVEFSASAAAPAVVRAVHQYWASRGGGGRAS